MWRLGKINKYIFSPIAILLTLILILSFIKYKKLRKRPGDIILAISIAEMISSIHWFATGLYAFFDE